MKIKDFFSYDRELASYVEENGHKVTLAALATPLFLELALRSMMNTVNTLILSRYTETAAGAIGTAGTLLNFLMLLFSMISTGVTVIIVQNLGAGNRRRAGEAATLSVVFCAVLSLALGVAVSFFSAPLMGMMNLQGQQLEEAVEYFEVVCRCNVISTMITVLAAIARSYGKTRINFIIALLMNGFNALFCAIVVFRPFEVPLYGIHGVAVARILAECAALIVNILFIRRMEIGFTPRAILKPDFTLIGQIFRFGLPSGMGSISYSISTIITTALVGSLGTMVITTKTYVSTVAFYSTMLGNAIGQATSILIGRYVGRGDMDKAYRLGIQSMKVGVLCNVCFAGVMLALTGPLFRLFFNASEEVIRLAHSIMAIDIFVEAGRAMNNVQDNALRSSGDVVYQAAIAMGGCWAFSVLFSFIFVKLGLGLYGVWIAFAMDECGRALLYLTRWMSKKWTTKRIIKDESAKAA